MLNKIFIMGRLTRDPELRRTQSGTPVTSFSLAVDRDFKSQSGEKETDFIDVVAWRQTAEFVARYFTKGRMAVVEGRLQIRDWQDRATNAAARRLLPTTSISATASATALPRVTMPRSAADAAAMAALRSTARPLAVIPPPWPLPRVTLPRSTRRTATCRSDVPRHNHSI